MLVKEDEKEYSVKYLQRGHSFFLERQARAVGRKRASLLRTMWHVAALLCFGVGI